MRPSELTERSDLCIEVRKWPRTHPAERSCGAVARWPPFWAGVTLGTGLTIASGFSGLVPGLGTGASAADGVEQAQPVAVPTEAPPAAAPIIALVTTGTAVDSVAASGISDDPLTASGAN